MEQRIGRYRILEEIASGSQGAVYRAFDPDSGQIVAVKVLHPSLTGNRDYLERFRREASLASSIDHSNVVKIFIEIVKCENDNPRFGHMAHLLVPLVWSCPVAVHYASLGTNSGSGLWEMRVKRDFQSGQMKLEPGRP